MNFFSIFNVITVVVLNWFLLCAVIWFVFASILLWCILNSVSGPGDQGPGRKLHTNAVLNRLQKNINTKTQPNSSTHHRTQNPTKEISTAVTVSLL